MLAWALLADAVALYPLYALLFADTGLSDAQISVLFALWSVVGIVAEVPTGALADRFSRRACLVASGVLQAAGFALWTAAPAFEVFAAGFVLWGLGGVLASGAQEALLYDGLTAAGAQEHYARVNGRIAAAELSAQLPAAALATALFPLGGYALVGWVSVGTCLAAAALACAIPEAPRTDDDEEDELGYIATLRAGLRLAATRPGVPGAVAAAALLASIDGIEEYFPLIVVDWGVPVAWVPVVDLPIVLGGIVGAALAGWAAARRDATVAALLAGSAVLFALAGFTTDAVPGVAAVAVFYGGYRMVLAVVDARLQDRIDSSSRATVTSVAGTTTDVAVIGLYGLWALGATTAVAAFALVLAAVLPVLLRVRVRVSS